MDERELELTCGGHGGSEDQEEEEANCRRGAPKPAATLPLHGSSSPLIRQTLGRGENREAGGRNRQPPEKERKNSLDQGKK